LTYRAKAYGIAAFISASIWLWLVLVL